MHNAPRHILLLAALAAAGCHEETKVKARPPLPVVVTRPEKVDLPIVLHYPAELQAIQQADVEPMEIRGYVTKMFVDKGDVVKAGQVLARLDCTPYSDEQAKLLEAVKQADARQHFAAETLDRIKPMAQQNFVGAQDLEQAEAEAETAAASLAHAQAAVKEVQHKIAFCDLNAPFSGDVTMRYVDPGALVGPGNPVLSMVDNSVMRVFVNLVEEDVGQVKLHQDAVLNVDAYPGHTFKGKVTRFVQALDPKTRTLLVEIDIPNPDGLLKPGMFGRVDIQVGMHRGAVVIPATSLVVQDGQASVFVAEHDVAKRKPLKLGFDDGKNVEVLEGVAPSDALVVAGQDLLGDGAAVAPHFETASNTTASAAKTEGNGSALAKE